MEQLLFSKLYTYLVHHHPDMLVKLQQSSKVNAWLEEQVEAVKPLMDELSASGTPAYIMEAQLMDALTKQLRPSRYDYISSLLAEEFESYHTTSVESGTLTYEIINMIEICAPVFEAFGFSELNEDDRQLYYAMTGAIAGYLEDQTIQP